MKYRLLSGIILFFGTFVHAYAQVNLKDGLVGCYPFSGNANDLSPIANHGRVNNAELTSDRFGNPESAYSFDGSSAYIEIDPAHLQLNSFTYSLWVYPRRLPMYGEAQFLFSVGSDYGDQHMLFGDHYSNERHTGLSHGSYLGVADNVLCSESGVNPLNRWYHLVLVRDNSNYSLYVNNQVVCVNSIQGKDAFYGISVVRAMIGARNNYGQHTDAVIDDIHLYNRALNTQEIEALFNYSPEGAAMARIETNPAQLCDGDRLTVQALSSVPASKFEFFENGQVVVITNHPNPELQASYSFPLPGSDTDYDMELMVRISFEDECFGAEPVTAQKTVRVKACSTSVPKSDLLFVPDVFSPNSDGKNDRWELINLAKYPNHEVSVFSRWGEVIFQSTNYDTPWDGTYRGKLVQPGVYTFKILSEKKLVKSGQIIIVY